MAYKIKIGNDKFEVVVGEVKSGHANVTVNGETYAVEIEKFDPASSPAADTASASGTLQITAPIPGVILDIAVKAGEKVENGQTVAIIEAMKMENNLVSSIDGIVREIRVQKGDKVKTGDIIMVIG